jgi:hypothetical protein
MPRPALSTGTRFKYIREGLSLGVLQLESEVTTYHHLVLRLRMSGVVPPLLLYFHIVYEDSLIFTVRRFISAGLRGKFATFNMDVHIDYMNNQARVVSIDYAVGSFSGRH